MTTTEQLRHLGRNGTVFGLVIGLAVGVLLATLALPKRQPTQIVQGEGGTGQSGRVGAFDPSAADGAAGAGAAPGTEDGSGEGGTVPGGDGATTAGGSAGAGTSGRGPAGGGEPGGGGGAPAGPVRAVVGVTDTKIRIGVALNELGALKALGPAFDNGDRRAHFEAILAGWKRDGAVPVHGRDVEFVYRSYGPISADEKRAACAGLMSDEKAFAVIADSQFDVGIECVAREHRAPIVTSDAPVSDGTYQRGAPFVFTLQMSAGRVLRNWIHWADRRGVLDDKQIGIYYFNDAIQREAIESSVKAELEKLGHEVAAEQSTDQNLGGPQDALAVQRFRTAGVDVALLFTSKAGFMQQAQAQGYKPTYLESDILAGTTNTATSTYPPEQFDGTFGMTGMRYGEWKAGIAPPPEAKACVATYARASGRRIDANAREAEYIALNKACDDAVPVLRALQGAGRALTREGFAQQLELVRDVRMGIHGNVTFGPGKHHGGEQQRTVKWAASCRCWRAIGSFGPLFVR